MILAPESFKRKALYALETLLRPLGLRPLDAGAVGQSLEAATDEAAPPGDKRKGIWYATEAPTDGNWLFVRLDPQTPRNITSSFRGGPLPLAAAVPLPPAGAAPPPLAGAVPPPLAGAAPSPHGAPFLFPGGIDEAGDPIASAFYWLAGCDYLANPERDQYGRVTCRGSLLDELGLTGSAPVDTYSEHVVSSLQGPSSNGFGETQWSLCPTFDVDYLRKWRPGIFYREFVEYALLGRGPAPRWPRAAASFRDAIRSGDPYRTALDRILSELDGAGATGTFFFKGGATSAHDVGYSLRSRFARRFMSGMVSGGHEIGLHPSFHAYNHPAYLETEARALARATGAPPTTVRTHYLRWEEPATPRHLSSQGFGVDSTLGFPDGSGFRNGTCRPFRIWDHNADRALDLWELPLAIMESCLFNREKLTAAQAMARTRSLMATVKRFGGTLVCLWHNVLWDEPDFAGWGEHFVSTLQAGRAEGAHIITLSEALSRIR